MSKKFCCKQACLKLSLLVSWIVVLGTGCSNYQPPEFQPNRVAMQQIDRDRTIPESQWGEISEILTEYFGTPDDPKMPDSAGFDLAQLKMAAGPVLRDDDQLRTGLYREHCSHCHGITGDGIGPTAAFLNPYPRDYRPGIFKFKSTERSAKPTTEDLRQMLHYGIPNTSMPSFLLLPEEHLDALIQYVKYLSIRGEMELHLIRELYNEGELDKSPEFLVGTEDDPGILLNIVESWNTAPEMEIEPAALPEGLDMDDPVSVAASALKGKEIYYSSVAGCVKCHGNAAMGDGQATDMDDWNRNITPEDVALGALPPRTIPPRNLRLHGFRGGSRPIDLYWRFYAGINGTPMPGLDGVVKAGTDLKPEELWHLVNYVRSLPYENDSAGSPREQTPQ